VDFPRLLGLVEQAVEQPLVLVIDDDDDLCRNLWDILRAKDYRVGLAHDQAEALRQLEGSDFRVVLIDMKLPGSSGADVFRTVHDARPEARTVLITGFRSETDAMVATALAEGADAVCYKPFDVPALLGALDNLTRRPEGHA
jgi:two-component system phosphate regulon response regulator OmpR